MKFLKFIITESAWHKYGLADANNFAFTFLELLICLLLIGIFFSLAIPAFYPFIKNNRHESVVNQLMSLIRFARHLALSEQRPITLCGSSDGFHCDGNWSKYQIVLRDQQLVRINAWPENINLIFHSTFGRNDKLNFLATGFTAGQQGSFYFQDSDSCLRLIITRTARITVELKGREC